jgi:hypothetical protein
VDSKTNNIRTLDEVRDYISHPCANNVGYNFWGDEMAIKILESVLKIKFIIFDMTPKLDKNRIEIGDIVILLNYDYEANPEDEDDEYRVVDIDYSDNRNPKYTIKSMNYLIKNVGKDEIQLSKNNIYSNIRISCTENAHLEDVTDCIFLLKTKLNLSVAEHYEFVRNTEKNNYVYQINDLPQYIYYFIFDSCFRFLKEDAKRNGFGSIDAFKPILDRFEEHNVLINQHIEEVDLVGDPGLDSEKKLEKYYYKLDRYNTFYKKLNEGFSETF